MKLSELREKRNTLQDELGKVFEESKTDDGGYDFREVKSLDVGDNEGYEKSLRVAELVREKNAELDQLSEQIESLEAAAKIGDDLDAKDREPAHRPPLPDGKREERKSLGRQAIEHPVFKQWQKQVGQGKTGAIELDGIGLKELKTLFETSAGWAPESTRVPGFVEATTRPVQVTDIIPSAQTGQASVVYMEETTRTHSAAEKAEGAAYAESTFALTEKSQTVRKITDSVPVTDEQLEDVAQAESYLDGRLRFGILQRLDNQILVGNGTAPNLEGINNVSGIQTQAKGSDPTPDAFFKAMRKIRVTGRAMPTHLIMHPNDWEPIRLLRTADGIYIWGNPSEAGPERMWGLPVVQSDAQTENTGLVGSFMPSWITLYERRGVVIEAGFVNDDFTKGKQTLRGSMRGALVTFRPAAFATVTGI